MLANADRNLLFGILALQMDFISRDQLVIAMNAWVFDKSRTLGQMLVRQQALSPDTHALIDTLVQKHVGLHDNDPQKSLASISPAGPDGLGAVMEALATVYDNDVQASLVHVAHARTYSATAQNAGRAESAKPDPFATTGLSTTAGLRFRILRPHAAGGIGEVFAARDEELHREVALKQIRPQHADNIEARCRFLLEAEITGNLEHPGIVPVYGLGQYADGRPFYAMRFIQGDSLKDAIDRFHRDKGSAQPGAGSGGFTVPAPHSPVPTSSSLEFRKLLGRFIDVCEAIQYAHDRGVLHRDLKPGNIMLGKYGETLVVDWGLAKAGVGSPLTLRDASAAGAATEPLFQPATSSGGTETLPGAAVGTPSFMSPEQAAGHLDQLGPASDVYSLGATLYTLLTGKPPVEGTDVPEILKRVREGGIPRPRAVAPNVDPALEAVCMKAMARKPADRYPSPRALAEDLERWLADKPVSAWREPMVVRAKRWARQHQTLVTSSAASLFIALITVAAGLYFYQDAENRHAKVQAEREQAETLRKLEAERKRAAAEEAIKNALDQAEKPHKELHAILAKPGGVFGLLNEPARWLAYIHTARTSLRAAQDMLGTAEPGVDPALAERAARLRELLERDESDRLLAAKFEEIRADKSIWVEGRFDDAPAFDQYKAAFVKADPGILKDPVRVVVARLTASPINEQLLSAMVGWAHVSIRVGNHLMAWRLWEIGRLAAPDPEWANRLAKIDLLKDRKGLEKLVKEAPISRFPASLMELIGDQLLGADHAERVAWFRQAQAQHPEDFWLNMRMGHALVEKEPVEAAGFYRVAIAIRPGSIAAYHNLGYSLERQGKQDQAIAVYQKAIDLNPKSAHAYNSLAFALNTKKDFPKALETFDKAIKCDPKFAMAHRGLGLALFETGQFAKAAESFQTGADLFKSGHWHKDCLDRLEQCRRMQKR